jgi:hypothetical protein
MAGAKKRFFRFESAQRETNATLLRIEGTLATSSKLFELMHMRLEHLEDGQLAVVDRLERLEEGQVRLVDGQVRLVGADRRLWAAIAEAPSAPAIFSWELDEEETDVDDAYEGESVWSPAEDVETLLRAAVGEKA